VAPDTIARVKDERIATVKLLTLEKLATAFGLLPSDLVKLIEEERRKLNRENKEA
jgi:DNA-binding Xre family transcriptional regulator